MQNQGAVAGIFVAVGIVLASVAAGFIYCLKRNQRIARRNRWLASLQQQPPVSHSENPFEGPDYPKIVTGTVPMIRSSDTVHGNIRCDISGVGPPLENQVAHEHPSISHAGGQHLLNPETHPTFTSTDPPYSDADGHHSVSIARSIDPPSNPRYGHSTTPSPPDNNDLLPGQPFPMVTQKPESVVNDPPPRPPRSRLRESAKSLISESPGSVSSHTHTKTRSPISDTRPQDVLSRRTILDVRGSSRSAS
jgi:hypothetical protein